MIDRNDIVHAEHVNDAVIGLGGGPWDAPASVMDEQLGLSMFDLLEVGFEYATDRFPAEHLAPLRQAIHSAWVYGAITIARAMREEAARRAA